jgi:hypothetical protein
VAADIRLSGVKRRAFEDLETADCGECEACAPAKTTRKHPNDKNNTSSHLRWTGDVATGFPASRYHNTELFVWVSPKRWVEGGFGKQKSGVFVYTADNYDTWNAQEAFTHARTDRGGEYTSKEFEDWFREKGIIFSRTAPNSSCGVAEEVIRVLKGNARAYLNAAGASDIFWDESVSYAISVHHMMPSNAPHLQGKSPWEERHGEKPPTHRLHEWGCVAFPYVDGTRTFANRGRRAYFVGLAKRDDDGYRFYDPVKRTIFHAKDAVFVGDVYGFRTPTKEPTGPYKAPIVCQHPLCKGNKPGVHHETCEMYDHDGQAEEEKEQEKEHDLNMDPEREKRTRVQRQLYDSQAWDAAYEHDQTNTAQRPDSALVTAKNLDPARYTRKEGRLRSGLVPDSYDEAMYSEDRVFWAAAIKIEITTLGEFKVFEEIPRASIPRGRKTITSRWVFAIKRLVTGKIERYKARLAARGYLQRYGLDYTTSYAATPALVAIRYMLYWALQMNFVVQQFDLKAAFVSTPTPEGETIFMENPQGYKQNHHKVMRLKKLLYGLKQASAGFFALLRSKFVKHNLTPFTSDPCLCAHRDADGKIDNITATHVDDGLSAGKRNIVHRVISMLSSYFTVKTLDGSLHGYVGIKVDFVPGSHCDLSQEALIDSILADHGMSDCNPAHVPARKIPLEPEEEITAEEEEFMKDKDLPKLVGGCGYVARGSRPDITEAYNYLSRCLVKPRRVHWHSGQQLLKYLKKTKHYVLRYYYTADAVDSSGVLKPCFAYTDSDYGGHPTHADSDGKSTSGFIISAANGASLDWGTQRQTTVARSTAEAELHALDRTTKKVLWMRYLESDMDIGYGAASVIKEDNRAVNIMASQPFRSEKMKHVAIKNFAVQHDVAEERILVVPVATEDNVADAFTKSLERPKFELFRDKMGVIDPRKN